MGCCVDLKGRDITEMCDSATEVSYQTVRKRLGKGLMKFAESMGYGRQARAEGAAFSCPTIVMCATKADTRASRVITSTTVASVCICQSMIVRRETEVVL